MSFLYTQVHDIDIQLDRLLLARSNIQSSLVSINSSSTDDEKCEKSSTRIRGLVAAISSLPTISPNDRKASILSRINRILSDPILKSQKCQVCALRLLQESDPQHSNTLIDQYEALTEADWHEHTLEWILLAKITIAVYWVVLNIVLDHSMNITDHIYYYDSLVTNDRHLSVYALQTAPLHIFRLCRNLYQNRSSSLSTTASVEHNQAGNPNRTCIGWSQLYKLAASNVKTTLIRTIPLLLTRPLILSRADVIKRQKSVKGLGTTTASALGLLLGDGLIQNFEDDLLPNAIGDDSSDLGTSKGMALGDAEWKESVFTMISVMDNILIHLQEPDKTDGDDLTFKIKDSVTYDPMARRSCREVEPTGEKTWTAPLSFLLPVNAHERLAEICDKRLPEYQAFYHDRILQLGRPSRWVRYWLPAVVAIMSSGTVFRILTNRKADIVTWVQDTGNVTLAFWHNWVIEPARKVINTIRHNEASDISMASRQSLQGDAESLERMVVDFVIDDARANNVDLSTIDIPSIRAKVHEGDVTPVLMAYENDLRHPLMGTVRGMLVRSLLIQVQKTKVDVALAISGIDNLLQSQELVFGVVSLTPGLLACFALSRWMVEAWQNRRGVRSWLRKDELVKELRNIDRTLWKSSTTDEGLVSYKDHGKLLCQVYRLGQIAEASLPASVSREFIGELDELIDVRVGVDRHKAAVTRLQWSFARWLQ